AGVPVGHGELLVAGRLGDDSLLRALQVLLASRDRDEWPLGVVGVGDLRLVVVQVAAQVEGLADARVGDRPLATRTGGDERSREDTETDQGGASHATRLAKCQWRVKNPPPSSGGFPPGVLWSGRGPGVPRAGSRGRRP